MIEVRRISYDYGEHKVLNDVSFDVKAGECVGVLGNNGAGKSTLVTCLSKIRTPKTGEVRIDGRNVSAMRRRDAARCIAYVAQSGESSRMTVFDAVLLGRKPYIEWAVSQADIEMCDAILNRVGMAELKLRYIDELSGGELQKAMLARALVQQPKLLLLDEPTSSLDPKNQHEMLALVRQVVQERNIGALIVIHDLSLALRYCNRFLFLKDGGVYAYGDASVVTEQTIDAVYGVASLVTEVGGRKIVVVG